MNRAGLSLILAVLLLSGCATGRSGKSMTPTQLQQVGEKFLAAGDIPTALKYLSQAEAARPENAMLQYDLGLAYNQRGMTDKAISHFQAALKLKPGYPEALNALGAVYAERGQVEVAQESFQKALADPFYQTPQLAAFNLGRLYEKKGDPERALSYYEQAVRFSPTYGAAWYRIGQIKEEMKRGDEARNAYGKAVSGSPDLAEAHLRYGIMSYLAGDMEAALFSLNRVMKLVPNTSMSDEARLYLERLRGVTRSDSPTARMQPVSPADIEVISRDEALHRTPPRPPSPSIEQKPAASTGSFAILPRETSVPAQAAASAPLETPAPVSRPQVSGGSLPGMQAPAAGDPSAASLDPSLASPQAPTYKYIVQMGSFVDKEKAEEFRENLRQKGYSAIVKPLRHKVLGNVYVLQLKPESSYSKATTLMTQLGSEVPGEPVILKVPVEPKAVNVQAP